MYSEIAGNKRRGVVLIGLFFFFVIWLAIGAACGFLFKAVVSARTSPPANYGWTPASHEISHVKNYDIRLLLIVGTMIGMATPRLPGTQFSG